MRPAILHISSIADRVLLRVLLVSLACIAPLDSAPSIERVPFSFRQWTVRHGLSSNSANVVIQDRMGFLWFGTETGLNRFDGRRFKVYQFDPTDSASLSNNYIWTLCEDTDGTIWIGTDGGGLNRFDPVHERFTRFHHDPADSTSLSSDVVQSVLRSPNGDLWAGTWGAGVNRRPRGSSAFVRHRHDPADPASLSDDKVHFIKSDRHGTVWVGTDNGLNRFDTVTGHWRQYIHRSGDRTGPSHPMVTDMAEAADGTLWFTLYGAGLDRFDPATGRFENFRLPASGPSAQENIFWKIAAERNGLFVITTQVRGLVLFDPAERSFEVIPERRELKGGLPSNMLQGVLEDRSGILWICSFGSGVFSADRNRPLFTSVRHRKDDPASVPAGFVYAFTADRDGRMYIGTQSDGVKRLDERFDIDRRFTASGRVKGDFVRSLYTDRDGGIWVGTYYGLLNRLDPVTGRVEHHDLDVRRNDPMRNFVRTIAEDDRNTIWFGANGGGGLTSFDARSRRWTHLTGADTAPPKLSGYDILSVCRDRQGYLWVGTQSYGLNRIAPDGRTVRQYRFAAGRPGSLPDNSVPELFVDSRGDLWIGTTSSGLARYRYESDAFEVFTREDGLPENSICGILEDGSGALWVSTLNALARFDPVRRRFDRFDHFDGIDAGEFANSSRYGSRDGRMFFGGSEGFIVFHPDSVRRRPDDAPVVFTGVKVLNREASTPKSAPYLDTLSLGYTENSFTIEFACLDLAAAERTEFSYRLEGADGGWTDAGRATYASFTLVPPGEYTFTVRRTDGARNARLHIIVAPPFWMTWWFRSMLVLAFLSAGPAVYYRRVTHLKQERRRQEESSRRLIESQETERRRIAAELHDGLGQNLLFIKNSATLGQQRQEPRRFSDISDAAASSIEEVRRIASDLFPYQLDRLGLSKGVESAVRRILESAGIAFTCDVAAVDHLLSKEKASSLFRIVQESLNNIVRHAGAKNALVRLERDGASLTVTVADDGRGFDPADVDRTGAGHGLRNIRTRAELLGGSVVYSASPVYRTVMTVTIPLEP